MGIFIIRNKNESKQKRLPWQEAVFSVAEKFGRLSPQGGDLVQINAGTEFRPHENHESAKKQTVLYR
jgi:hypothetical protein